MSELDNTHVSALLGKAIAAPRTYDKSILVREPRQSNRRHLQIKDEALPFVGYDVWNAWEISTLTFDGRPVTGIAKLIYPCSSKYIVESKSLKLYFNSYNMTQMGNTPKEALDQLRLAAERDLSELLECQVNIGTYPATYIAGNVNDWLGHNDCWSLLDYVEGPIGKVNRFEQYQESPELLRTKVNWNGGRPITQRYWSTLLKSNCRVTKQSDWGDVYVYIKGIQPVDEYSLLQYIISFRDECHFHEEIIETIYKRLWDTYHPDELMVIGTYVRRGGIDINPARSSHFNLIPNDFFQVDCPFVKSPRQ